MRERPVSPPSEAVGRLGVEGRYPPAPATDRDNVRCKEHPAYEAKRHPAKTTRYPDGCPTCWGVWEGAKVDPKRRATTVNLELMPDEARAMVLSLNTVLNGAGVPRTAASVLGSLMERLAKSLKG